MIKEKSARQIKLDARNHVEKPFLNQLCRLVGMFIGRQEGA